jgi:hypothetical protein
LYLFSYDVIGDACLTPVAIVLNVQIWGAPGKTMMSESESADSFEIIGGSLVQKDDCFLTLK